MNGLQHAPAEASTTIFALASGAPPAAIAIMRLSGPRTDAILEALAGSLTAPRLATLRVLRHAGEALDQALVLRFPGPGSYTGEDSAELHLHAGAAVIEAVADALLALGATPAEPGEFTRRACLSGRIGLLEAEAIADLVAAETGAQRRQALDQLGGGLSRLYEGWAQRLRLLLARQEALIDFPDEDLPDETDAANRSDLRSLCEEMQAHLADGARSERIRSGVRVVIAGAPNAGKSSLLNALSGGEDAIVSPIAGTTRDAISVRLQVAGTLVSFIDTAGLHETGDAIEAEGIRRARAHAARADLVLSLVEPGAAPEQIVTEAECWVIRSKADLLTAPAAPGELAISTRSGQGLDRLREKLVATVRRLTAGGAGASLTQARHRAGVEEAVAHLRDAQAQTWPELRGEALRLAMLALGRLTGRIGVEDVLDTIFGQFCIGK